MNPETDYGLPGSGGNGKLRQWLIEQVDCGKYAGLVWENDDKSIFRIPWKHAGKQDYNRDEDAALFKAWALFKGKYREGVDKPDPPTWKTRLRCALNKSNDFEELVARSQLDISDPYKVYHIIPEGAKKRARDEDERVSPLTCSVTSSFSNLQTYQMAPYVASPECGWRDFVQDHAALAELPFAQCPCPPRSLPWQDPSADHGYQLRASIYSLGPAESQTSSFSLDGGVRSGEALRDLRLHVSVFLRESLVREVTTFSPEGCHITPAPPQDERYLWSGGRHVVPLPVEASSAPGPAEERPAGARASLEGGVLCWMAPDGLYAQRLCEGKVYWQTGLAHYGDLPKKLEREVTCKLLHAQDYLTEMQNYGLHSGPLTSGFQVLLTFGDERPDSRRPTLAVQVEPLFARQRLYYTHPPGGHLYRSYEHASLTEQMGLVADDYHRTFMQHHGLQD
ncbi:interferon regulatory factor 4-like [Vanacampus margaritifer]